MKIEMLLIFIIILLIVNNSKNKEFFNNKKYFNLKKRIEPSNSKTLPYSKLFDQREFIKPGNSELWNLFYGNNTNSRVKDYDRLFLTN